MAKDQLPSSSQEVRSEAWDDPWGDLLGRVGSGGEEGSTAELALGQEKESESAEGSAQRSRGVLGGDASQRSRRSSRRARLTVVTVLLGSAAALLRIIGPAILEGGPSAAPSRPRPVLRLTHPPVRPVGVGSAPRPKRRHSAERWRVGNERVATGHRTHRSEARHRPEEEPPVPVSADPPTSSSPGVTSPPPVPQSALMPGEPASPPAGQPSGGAGLKDGSRSSAEFGL
jgi:hypothetical protein